MSEFQAPWIVEESYDFYSIRCADGNALTIGEGDEGMKLAERIVEAVNNHKALMKLVRATSLIRCENKVIISGYLREEEVRECKEHGLTESQQCHPCKARALIAKIKKESAERKSPE